MAWLTTGYTYALTMHVVLPGAGATYKIAQPISDT